MLVYYSSCMTLGGHEAFQSPFTPLSMIHRVSPSSRTRLATELADHFPLSQHLLELLGLAFVGAHATLSFALLSNTIVRRQFFNIELIAVQVYTTLVKG